MRRVEGKVAFITGAARGQGRAFAVRLAEEGADIIAVDICHDIDTVPYGLSTAEDLAETVRLVEGLGRRIISVEADVRDCGALDAALAQGGAAFGRVDIVVANAGIFSYGTLRNMSAAAWQDMIDINLTGVWNTVRAALPYLTDGGTVVIISSTAALKGTGNVGHYVAAKTAVVGVMRTLAVELAPHNIRVNTIQPTNVGTHMILNDATLRLFCPELANPTVEDFRERAKNAHLLPNLPYIEPVDVANVVLFLASDETRYITGISIPVDAGGSIK